jgi:hypothetical protein
MNRSDARFPFHRYIRRERAASHAFKLAIHILKAYPSIRYRVAGKIDPSGLRTIKGLLEID